MFGRRYEKDAEKQKAVINRAHARIFTGAAVPNILGSP